MQITTKKIENAGTFNPYEKIVWETINARPYSPQSQQFSPEKRAARMKLDLVFAEELAKWNEAHPKELSNTNHVVSFPHCNTSQTCGSMVAAGFGEKFTLYESNHQTFKSCKANLEHDRKTLKNIPGAGRIKTNLYFASFCSKKSVLEPKTDYPGDYPLRKALRNQEFGRVLFWDLDVFVSMAERSNPSKGQISIKEASERIRRFSTPFFGVRISMWDRGVGFQERIDTFHKELGIPLSESIAKHSSARATAPITVWQGTFHRPVIHWENDPFEIWYDKRKLGAGWDSDDAQDFRAVTKGKILKPIEKSLLQPTLRFVSKKTLKRIYDTFGPF